LSLSKPPRQKKIFQWNSVLEVCEGKTTCHTKMCVWTKTDDKFLQAKTNITLVLTSVKVTPKTHCHSKNNHTKHDFPMKNKSRWFWGKATHHLWLFVLMKQTCNKTKWKQMSTWGWPLSRWCQQHTVTANTVTQDMFFPMTHHVEKIEGKAKHCICLLAWTKKLDHQDQLKTNTKLVLNSARMMQTHTVTAETSTQNMIFLFSKTALWWFVRTQKHVKFLSLCASKWHATETKI